MQLGFQELIRIAMLLGFFALAIGLVVFVRGFRRMQARPPMLSLNARPGSTERRPHTLRVQAFMPEGLLWHLTRLPGVQVVSTKTIAGDPTQFESYFLYKERLFVMEEPFWVTISLLGQPPDKALFAEVEHHVQRYNRITSLYGAIAAALRFFRLPRNPPRSVIDSYCPDQPAGPLAKRRSIHPSGQGPDNSGIDPLAEAEVYLSAGQKEMAIQILEQAAEEDPTLDNIRKRSFELKRGN
jgi:hypothetical protein